jgi:hypothetical protein
MLRQISASARGHIGRHRSSIIGRGAFMITCFRDFNSANLA